MPDDWGKLAEDIHRLHEQSQTQLQEALALERECAGDVAPPRPRLTLIQGGGETVDAATMPLPRTRAELRTFCNALLIQLGGDPVA